MTLLHLLAQQQENLQQLTHYSTRGETITEGIMDAVGGTISGLEGAGVKFINAIAGGIAEVETSIGNTTGGLLESAGKGVGAVLKSLGGIPMIVCFAVEVLIIGYLVVERKNGSKGPPIPQRRGTHQREITRLEN